MPVSLLRRPYSNSSRFYPFIFPQFSFHRTIMKRRKDSNYAMDDGSDKFDDPSICNSKFDDAFMDKRRSLSAKKLSGSYGKRKTGFDLRHFLNQRSNEGKKDLATFRPLGPLSEDFMDDHDRHPLPGSFGKQKLTDSSRKAKQHHKYPADDLHQIEPFSLILPRSRNSVCKRSGDKRIEMENNLESSHKILKSGMILLKNNISLSDQVEIVNICQELGVSPGGFYQPGYQGGAKLRLQMMCLGRNWDPQTKYDKLYRSDGSKAPPIPDKLISLVKDALRDSHALIDSEDELPLMSPDVCIVNFYTTTGRLGLHQDRDESPDSLDRGLPVVSISIGDSAEFLYGDKRDVDKADKVLLESGDVLIFGGKSRHVFHGVKAIIPNSAPPPLLEETILRPGRLNLTFRQF